MAVILSEAGMRSVASMIEGLGGYSTAASRRLARVAAGLTAFKLWAELPTGILQWHLLALICRKATFVSLLHN
ncbi:hypothetical protein BB405_27985 (plasmid) [Escherichia coli]|nr:hypothetical protein BB405_27985 [Escherichia coli]